MQDTNVIKVLQFPLANSKGGMARYELNNWKWIDKTRFHFDFVSFSDHIDFDEEILATGAKIFYMKNYAEINPKGFEEELKKILKNGYDIVHLHTNMWGSLLAEKVVMDAGINKIIIHSHSTSIFGKKNIQDIQKLHDYNKKLITDKIATDFWACSQEAAEWLYGDKISKEKIKIMPNAIESFRFKYDEKTRKEYRESLCIDDKFVLGCVANFIYQKNHDFLVDLMQEMGPDTVLLLVGSGPLKERVMKKVDELGLTEKIIFLGYRNDSDKLYQCMDVVLLPSIAEAFPYVTVEAQVSGVQCLVSDNVTTQVDFTSNICHEELIKDKWIEKILELKKKVFTEKRISWDHACKEKGLDYESAIQLLEKEYSR
ncbi:Glycosyltransferase involved in cell wall bisynthesis [Lachnospiraceae bacterium A10]|nr:Glycosyltransferase involved in cell wall bisynthesis [Lachnospiraceae bacterium A10]